MSSNSDWINSWRPTQEDLNKRDEKFEAELNAERDERAQVQEQYDKSPDKPEFLDQDREM